MRLKSLVLYARAFQMFVDEVPLTEVAIELEVKTDVVLDFLCRFSKVVEYDWPCKHI